MRAIEKAAEAADKYLRERLTLDIECLPLTRAAVLAFLDGVDKDEAAHVLQRWIQIDGRLTARETIGPVLSALRAQAGETE